MAKTLWQLISTAIKTGVLYGTCGGGKSMFGSHSASTRSGRSPMFNALQIYALSFQSTKNLINLTFFCENCIEWLIFFFIISSVSPDMIWHRLNRLCGVDPHNCHLFTFPSCTLEFCTPLVCHQYLFYFHTIKSLKLKLQNKSKLIGRC